MACTNRKLNQRVAHQETIIASLTKDIKRKQGLLDELVVQLENTITDRDNLLVQLHAKQSREVENRSTKPLRALAIK